MIKLGFVSAVVADRSFEKTVDLAAELGFDCVELLCWPAGKAERRYAGVTHIDVVNLDDNALAHILDYTSKKGINISGLGYYPNYLEDDKSKSSFYINHFKQVITASKKLGVGIANTFIGADQKLNIEDNYTKFKKLWPEILEHAEKEQVRIGIENCPMFFTGDEWPGGKNLAHSPAIWRRMFEDIRSDYFGLNYDPSHLVWQMMDHIAPIYEFRDRIFHIHNLLLHRSQLGRRHIRCRNHKQERHRNRRCHSHNQYQAYGRAVRNRNYVGWCIGLRSIRARRQICSTS